MALKKIVFCNVPWLKRYQGVTDDDKPINGGSYFEENEESAVCYIFQVHNHNCYGSSIYGGETLNIERIANVGDDVDMINDVTVIWTALSEEGRKIVGWYEHAEMYRNWQCFYDNILDNGRGEWWYHFKTREENAYIIPINARQFEVPSATTDGKGRGFGRSNIWYADSVYAREEFVPKVFDYLNKMRSQCHINFITAEQAKEKAQYSHNFKIDKLLRDANKFYAANKPLEALRIYNLLETRTIAPQDKCAVKFIHGDILRELMLYDEAIELYKRFMFDYSQLDDEERSAPTIENMNLQITHLDCMKNLAAIYMAKKDYFSACSLYQRYLDIEESNALKCEALYRLMYMFNDEQDWQHLRETIETYDNLHTDILSEEVAFYRKVLNEQKGNDVESPSEYINEAVVNPQRDRMFPRKFTFKGVKFTRVDDSKEFKAPYNVAINKMWRDMQSGYQKLKLVLAIYWPLELTQKEGNRRSVLERSQDTVKIKNQILPYELDIQIIDCVLINNAEAISAHSIFTEFISFVYLKNFKSRVKKYNLSFIVNKAECELYIADYTEAKSGDVDEYTGVISFTDEEAEATLNY